MNESTKGEETTETKPDAPKSLFFTCGHIVNRNIVIIPGQYNAFPDADISRVMLKFDDTWVHHDVDTDVIGSVAFNDDDQTLYMLGRNGTVRVAGGGVKFNLQNLAGKKFRDEFIDNGNYGELLCIKTIGRNVLVSGQSLQVYIRRDGKWQPMDGGMRKRTAPELESIDGTGMQNIYAVGEKGVIFHYDGRKWSQLDSPTNRPLSKVLCVSEEETYICGNDGLIFKGVYDNWTFIGDTEIRDNFWDMAFFEGKLYIAHSRGLFVFEDGTMQAVRFQFKKQISCHRLHEKDGVLWSFGIDHLLFFDGLNWTEVVCPENQ